MMPQIDISPSNFARLQKVARPFVDTPDTVVGLLLDHFESTNRPKPSAASPEVDPDVQVFDPSNPPNLTHTKMTWAAIGGVEVVPYYWSNVLHRCVALAFEALGGFAEVKRASGINMVEGLKTDHGYQHIPGVNISVQGQDAQSAWRAIVRLARRAKLTVAVSFVWFDKETAAFPGGSGSMVFTP